jgi:hypothetical protein
MSATTGTPDTALIYASLDKQKADAECARLRAAASAEEDLLDAEDEEDEENHGSFRGHQISYFVESVALEETTENS